MLPCHQGSQSSLPVCRHQGRALSTCHRYSPHSRPPDNIYLLSAVVDTIHLIWWFLSCLPWCWKLGVELGISLQHQLCQNSLGSKASHLALVVTTTQIAVETAFAVFGSKAPGRKTNSHKTGQMDTNLRPTCRICWWTCQWGRQWWWREGYATRSHPGSPHQTCPRCYIFTGQLDQLTCPCNQVCRPSSWREQCTLHCCISTFPHHPPAPSIMVWI